MKTLLDQNKEQAGIAVKLKICGAVQGVGFRPFIYNLARTHNIYGFIQNTPEGVSGIIEGSKASIGTFLYKLKSDKPPHAVIDKFETESAEYQGLLEFEIRSTNVHSDSSGDATRILPDLAICPDCNDEIFNPKDRRYRYPFTTCTNCGPRYSVIESLPYDRERTTMVDFPMCDECLAEYRDPSSRRFHAQSNACWSCGPTIFFNEKDKDTGCSGEEALISLIKAIKKGKIVAVKGLGGYLLMADATNSIAIKTLRQRKKRPAKPFALMMRDSKMVRRFCHLSEAEETLLASPQSPIVLLRKNSSCPLVDIIAPGMKTLGVMLPYTPFFKLLMSEFEVPLIATSGNLSEEPLCVEDNEASARLAHIADAFLTHNRRIARGVDDSVSHVINGEAQLLRAARGYAPISFKLNTSHDLIATGAHLKNTVALNKGSLVILSQHLGDLENIVSFKAFTSTVKELTKLYWLNPEAIACDLHPDYRSTRFAEELAEKQNVPLEQIQHHYAHARACYFENNLKGKALAVTWDGTGYGVDKTVWGGEFLLLDHKHYSRFAYLKPFPLPGGEAAVKDCRRSAFGALWSIYKEQISEQKLDFLESFDEQQISLLIQMLSKKLNSPLSSSAGRLFDIVSGLLGLCTTQSFEGEAAIKLEQLIDESCAKESYPFKIQGESYPFIIDWQPLLSAILADLSASVSPAKIAARFHFSMVDIIIAMAKRCAVKDILLSGGCFQNRFLLEHAISSLKKDGFNAHFHKIIPPNDGGIALGQLITLRNLGNE